MKILVTGAAGFIGSHLSEALKKQGHSVMGVDNFAPYYSEELKRVNEEDLKEVGVEVENLDLAEDDLSDLVTGIEVVYHLAAQPGISAKTPFEDYLKNNIIATNRLLNSLENVSVKLFVNIATSSCYGSDASYPEDHELKPTSYYGVTKLAAEQLVLARQREKGLPACSTRLFSVYGERERPEKLHPKVIYSILDSKYKFPLFEGSKGHLRSFTYVGDIVDGLVSVLENRDKCIGEIFNLGLDVTSTTGEIISIIEELMGKKAKFDIVPKRAGDQEKTSANIQKARRILGYNPTTKPEEGLKKEIDWFKEKVWQKINLYQ
ncbi:NAD-dependent epimerase/dehydratase family protein [Patescibacteria group bacterium]|nr:NAD-dependent epimerase/dehydratase family protein [Patescibacteria group bacterium]